jgi:predicted transcriptional regulator
MIELPMAQVDHAALVDPDAEAMADTEGLADLDAGRVVSGEAVKRWLRSWGTPEELPAPGIGE